MSEPGDSPTLSGSTFRQRIWVLAGSRTTKLASAAIATAFVLLAVRRCGVCSDSSKGNAPELGHSTPHLVFAAGAGSVAKLARLGWQAESDGVRVEAIQLALGALTAEQSQRLEGGLEELGDRLEAELTPAPLGLEEGQPWDSVLAEVQVLLPTLNASTHLARRHTQTIDGSFASTVEAQCPDQPDLGCVVLWASNSGAAARGEEEDRGAKRARFLHWPLSCGALLEMPGPDAHRRALATLRRSASRAASSLGLVVSEQNLATSGGPDQERIRQQARRALRVLRRLRQNHHGSERLRTLENRLLIPLAADPAPGRPVPWLRLAQNDILVVPRMGSLVSANLTLEIERALGPDLLGRVQWVHRPRPLGD